LNQRLNTFERAVGWLVAIGLIFLGLAACSQKGIDGTIPTSVAETEAVASDKDFYQFTLEKEFGNGIVEAADWAPAGSTFALATSLQVDIYDPQSFEIITTLDTGQSNQEIAYSPDSKLLAMEGDNKAIQLWDIQSEQLILCWLLYLLIRPVFEVKRDYYGFLSRKFPGAAQ